MHGQKSCRHEFTRKLPLLAGHGYVLVCVKCGKFQPMTGRYTKEDYPGGRFPPREQHDKPQ